MKHLPIFIFLSFCFPVQGQEPDNESIRLRSYLQALRDFSRHIPQEKVYLHFDNTSYYQGDPIWFKCYVTTAQHQLSELSKTLYVELLNPGGEIISTRILKMENGQCHGDFRLTQLPFYSGFYEVRAYTKYMLNFGDEVIFSRLLPVFNKPKTEGHFEEKAMLNYSRLGMDNYPMKREEPEKGKAVNLRFFPEGGNPVQGVASRIAFEATDETGNPIEVTGMVVDGTNQVLCSFSSTHEGRGIFRYTPGDAGRRKDVAEVDYSGKKYRFDLPDVLPQGVIMEVDNLSHPDSIGISLRKNSHTPSQMVGVVVLHGGKFLSYRFTHITQDNEVSFRMDKTQFPSGVSQVVVFNVNGAIVCDRLVFTGGNKWVGITAKTDKSMYKPLELVDMVLSVTDRGANPVQTTFSLSVRDGANEVEGSHHILTDLLLMSEIKGFVRNPPWYFEDDDEMRRTALDVLLMVQGWRRYSWNKMAGLEPLNLKYFAEQGIETNGTVVSLLTQTPKPSVDVDMLLVQKAENDAEGGGYMDSFVTDNLGRFSFVSDVNGRWNMVLSVSEKGKKKDHQILLDRLFSPKPGAYRYADLQVHIAAKNSENNQINDDTPDDAPDHDGELFFASRQDSLAKLGIGEQVRQLTPATVRARRRTQGQDIYQNRSTSVAYYDVATESDRIYDSGKYIGKNIHELLKNMNPDFSVVPGTVSQPLKVSTEASKNMNSDSSIQPDGDADGDMEWMLYRNRMVLFVIDYERVDWSKRMSKFGYQYLNLSAIKSIYINETTSAFCEYFFIPGISCELVRGRFGCVVFIETYPDGQIPVEGAHGVRKTWLEGYSPVSEFYSPNYSVLPPMPDYRRTLYWNPMVTTDEFGQAHIQFYNNSSAKNFSISAETVTPSGMIGIYK